MWGVAYERQLDNGAEDAVGGDDLGHPEPARQRAPAAHGAHVRDLHRYKGLPATRQQIIVINK